MDVFTLRLHATGKRIRYHIFGAGNVRPAHSELVQMYIPSAGREAVKPKDISWNDMRIRSDDNINSLKMKVYSLQPAGKHRMLYMWCVRSRDFGCRATCQEFIDSLFSQVSLMKGTSMRAVDLVEDFIPLIEAKFGPSAAASIRQRYKDDYNAIDMEMAFLIMSESVGRRDICTPLGFRFVRDGVCDVFDYDPSRTRLDDASEDGEDLLIVNDGLLTLETVCGADCRVLDVTTSSDKAVSRLFFPNILKKSDAKLGSWKREDDEVEREEMQKEKERRVKKKEVRRKGSEPAKKTSESREHAPEQHAELKSSLLTMLHVHSASMFRRSQSQTHDLGVLFANMHTTRDMFCIKYKSTTDTFLRLHKTALVEFSVKKLQHWTSVSPVSANSFIRIILRMPRGGHVILYINTDLSFSVKFKMDASGAPATMASLRAECFPSVNAILDRVYTLLRHPLRVYLPSPGDETCNDNLDVDIEQIISRHVIRSDIGDVSEFIDDVASNMSQYFNAYKDPSGHCLQYKRTDNYSNDDNIQHFIQGHTGSTGEPATAGALQSHFGITMKQAEEHIDRWTTLNVVHAIDGRKGSRRAFMRPDKNFYDSFATVRIARAPDGKHLVFITSGIKSVGLNDRLLILLRRACAVHSTWRRVDGARGRVSRLEAAYDKDRLSPSSPFLTTVSKSRGDDDDDGDSDSDSDVSRGVNALDDFGESSEEDDDGNLQGIFRTLLHDVSASPSTSPVSRVSSSRRDSLSVSSTPPRVAYQVDVTSSSHARGSVLKALHAADPDLFGYLNAKKRKVYSTQCQSADHRVPVVMTLEERDENSTRWPDSFKGSVQAGSTELLAATNHYICPEVWCSVSRETRSFSDFAEHGCPKENEAVVMAKASGAQRMKFPGFLGKARHPDKLDVPCCFVKPVGPSKRALQLKSSDAADKDPRYIKSSTYFPLEHGRFGKLPDDALTLFSAQDQVYGKVNYMNAGTNCLLRYGVTSTSCPTSTSYMVCIAHALGLFPDSGPEVAGNDMARRVLDSVAATLTMDLFLTLEHGKVMKHFMAVPGPSSEFKEWFIHKDRSRYVKRFHLEHVKRHLISFSPSTSDPSVRASGVIGDTLREELMYTAFRHFKAYIGRSDIIPDHRLLVDLFNRVTDLNPEGVQFVTLDVSHGRTVMQCPFSRDTRTSVNADAPVVFLVQHVTGAFELISHVRIDGVQIDADVRFDQSSAAIRRVMGVYVDGCSRPPLLSRHQDAEAIAAELTSRGHSIEFHVIDHSFGVVGLLLTNHVYVPLKRHGELSGAGTSRYLYVTDPLMSREGRTTAKERDTLAVMKVVREFTGDAWYENAPSHIADGDDQHRRSQDIFNGTSVGDRRSEIIKVYNDSMNRREGVSDGTMSRQDDVKLKNIDTVEKRRHYIERAILARPHVRPGSEAARERWIDDLIHDRHEVARHDGFNESHDDEIFLNSADVRDERLMSLRELYQNPVRILY